MQQRRIRVSGKPRKQINLDLLAEAILAISEQLEPTTEAVVEADEPDQAAS